MPGKQRTPHFYQMLPIFVSIMNQQTETGEALSTGARLKAIIGGSIGNLVEWYDWYAYAAFAVYFSPVFFPNSDPTAQLLNTAGIFAVGFFMRPVGGWLFGRIADRQGRKKAMTLSITLMSLGSLIIACIPTYDSIGFAAPFLLFLARLLQGLSVGGEYGTAATYLSEMAGKGSRGFYSSFQYVTLIGGQLTALGIQVILQRWLLSEAELQSWGWRIPFVIGALLSVVALYLRSNLEESAHFKAEASPRSGSIRELLRHPKAIATVVGLTLGGTVAFYTYSIYMQKFLVNTAGLSRNQSTTISFLSLFLFVCLQPPLGALSDRVGRRPLLLSFGLLGTLFTFPLLTAISQVYTATGAFFLIMCGLLIISGYTSINAVVKAELFPASIRALGVGLPYAMTTALFGGTAEYIALWCKNRGQESLFYWYVTACILISLLVYWRMKDTRLTSLIDRGH
jgi:MHS family alpha-ketoglutarate permease-like MFS transporter